MNKQNKFLVFITSVVYIIMSFTTIQANNIPVLGLNADDAIITDQNGKVINHNQQLSQWDSYQVEYNWSIPNDIKIKAGDTTSFQIPNNVIVPTQTNFNMYDEKGQVIAYVNVPANSHTGKITFTNEMANQTDRKGSFKFWVKGSTETFIPDSFVTKGGKIDNGDYITWNIILNKNSESLNNIHIVDTIQNNMKLNTNSIKIYSGEMINGQFYSTGSITPDKLNIDGATINIDFNQINSPIEIVYTVQKNPGTDFYNKVGVNVNGENYGAYAHVLTGGSGSGEGNTPISSSSKVSSSSSKIGSSSKVSSSSSKIGSSSKISSSSSKISSSSKVSSSSSKIGSSSKVSSSSSKISSSSKVSSSSSKISSSSKVSSSSSKIGSSSKVSSKIILSKIENNHNNNTYITSNNSKKYVINTKSESNSDSNTINQTRKQKLPQTGGDINVILSALGLILLISIGSYIAYHHN